MKLRIMSDIHSELSDFTPPPADADAVVLAGDIGKGCRGLYWARERFPDSAIIYVAGNHEFYGQHLHRASVEMAHCAKELGITLLDSSSAVIGGVRFIGTTLWTDFELFGSNPESGAPDAALESAKNSIADFRTITFGSTGWLLPEHTVILHRAARAFLLSESAKPFDGKTVFVTHHAPSIRSALEKYRHDPVTAAFASRLEDLAGNCDLWIHGHMHNTSHYRIGDRCEVVCNPRGYGSESTGWMPDLVFDI